MDLDALLARFRGPLVGYFATRGASPREAREFAQDVFAEAYIARSRFRGDWDDLGAAGGFLRGIAANRFRAERRRAARAPALLGSEPGPGPADARTSEPVDAAARHERRARVRAAIDALRTPWRTVLYMHYIEGSGLAEIGALLGISERAVEGRLRRARAELGSALEAEETRR